MLTISDQKVVFVDSGLAVQSHGTNDNGLALEKSGATNLPTAANLSAAA